MLNATNRQRTDFADKHVTDTWEEMLQPALAAIVATETNKTDAVLDEVVKRLQRKGYRLSGLRQRVLSGCENGCGVRLQDIDSGDYYRITQDLGSGSTSCNIDTAAVEQLALAQSCALDDGFDMVVINRFGKRESDGHGFCAVIERAVELGIPVLTVVKQDALSAWLAYGGECVSTLRSDKLEIESWCERALPVSTTFYVDV